MFSQPIIDAIEDCFQSSPNGGQFTPSPPLQFNAVSFGNWWKIYLFSPFQPHFRLERFHFLFSFSFSSSSNLPFL